MTQTCDGLGLCIKRYVLTDTRISHASVAREDVAIEILHRRADALDAMKFSSATMSEAAQMAANSLRSAAKEIGKALLPASPAQAVAPPGWRMVPEEPTETMLTAFGRVWLGKRAVNISAGWLMRGRQSWKAMLSAAALTTPDEQRGEG